jgi:hypothetical protein
VIFKLPSQPALSQAFALVASPMLGLQQFDFAENYTFKIENDI